MRRASAAVVAAALLMGTLVAGQAVAAATARGTRAGSPATLVAHGAVRPRTALVSTPAKGIAISLGFANRITNARAMTIANSLMWFVSKKLHANAVSLNFPFWQKGSASDDPGRAPMTSSPQRLVAISRIAERYGLMVQWRPYLYEGDLQFGTHNSIFPQNPSQWMNNYWEFLKPYLVQANLAGVSSFSVALELRSMLPFLSQWTTIVERAKTLFSGELLYSQQHTPQESLPLTARGFDAYQPIRLRSAAGVSVAAFTKGFERNLRAAAMQSTPADLTLEEVSIPATKGAYDEPAQFHYPPGKKLDRAVQTDWFEGACNAFYALHLRGIYYYAIAFDRFSPSENQSSSIYGWLDTTSQQAIASCYERTGEAAPRAAAHARSGHAAPSTSWDPDSQIEPSGGHPSSVSCPIASFCVVVDRAGDVVSDDAGTWSAPTALAPDGLDAVSCASVTLCVAVDDDGNAYTYDGTGWTSDPGVSSSALTAVSCAPGSTSCVAVGAAGQAVAYAGGTWSAERTVATSPLTSVACPAADACTAVDAGGEVLSQTASGWSSPRRLVDAVLTSVACPSVGACVAGDESGRLFAESGRSWRSHQSPFSGGVASLACGPSGGCVGVGASTVARISGTTVSGRAVLFPGDEAVAATCSSDGTCGVLSYDGSIAFETTDAWTAPVRVDAEPGQLTAVSCGSASFCVAVDDMGGASTWTGTGWSAPVPTGTTALSAVSCAGLFCAAVGDDGDVVTSIGGTWAHAHKIDSSALTGISCVSLAFCVAVDASDHVLTFDGSHWSLPRLLGVYPSEVRGYTAVSCATTTFCVAVATDGQALLFGGAHPAVTRADTPLEPLTSVSCATAKLCVAVDEQGREVTLSQFEGGPLVWARPRRIDDYRLTGVSCTAKGVCLASDDQGGTVALASGTWGAEDQTVPLTGALPAVACAGDGTCATIDATSAAVGAVSG